MAASWWPHCQCMRAERVGVGEPAGLRVEHARLGQALVGEEVAALAGDDADRQAGAAAGLLQHDRDQHRVGVAALERAVDQQLLRAAVPAGAQRHVRHGLAERASCAAGSVSSSARIAAESAVSVALGAVGVELAELPGQRESPARREAGR